ncbi:hypothetical protein [Pseudonocardia nigra]|uniref:hypothetical protein n=1 Tax=Pseudonocardia nigra TaxID=1921578 RepID=UPI001C5D4567|nr:hypothetical protein [Pseudonocardia nigra]
MADDVPDDAIAVQPAAAKRSTAEINAEFAHLRRLNKRHGAHPARTAALNRLAAVLRQRRNTRA